MIKTKRIISLMLVLLLLLSSSTVLADNEKTKKENPSITKTEAAIKGIEEPRWIISPHIRSTKGHRVEIVGKLDIDENLKGSTKVKLKVNNVTVNPNTGGSFSRFMSKDKDAFVTIKVFVGKVEIEKLSKTLYLVDNEESSLEKARIEAEGLINKINIEKLTLEDKELVEDAREALDVLRKLLKSPVPEYYRDLETIVKRAEDKIKDLEQKTLRWVIEPYLEDYNNNKVRVYGKLFIPDKLKGSLKVYVNDVESLGLDGIVDITLNNPKKNIIVEVYEDNIERVDLERTLRLLTDKEAAELIELEIGKLNKKIVLDDRDQVIYARLFYEKLTNQQKLLVKNLSVLITAERILEEKEISWSLEPRNTGDREFFGRLSINESLEGRVKLQINNKFVKLDDGEFYQFIAGNRNIYFNVYLDDIIIDGLTRTAR